MTFAELALRLYPMWILGLFMIFATYFSEYRSLLRVELKLTVKWLGFLCLLTIYRIFIFKMFSGNETLQEAVSGAMTIPWQAALTVFWEDMCHGIPLAILSMRMGLDKFWKKAVNWLAILVVMVAFGLGHVYQGYIAAALLSLYVPYTLKRGKEVGFGTVMICHSLYDLVTILTLQYFLG